MRSMTIILSHAREVGSPVKTTSQASRPDKELARSDSPSSINFYWPHIHRDAVEF